MHCTVVIPTKNAMPYFARVLDAVLRQKTRWDFDVVVIDSGSKDGTAESCRRHERVRLIPIDPKEFGHGRTRNRAVEATDAPFVAFLTHDALPADDDWLQNLVDAVEQDANVAGAFGRHVANEDADPFTERDLRAHFEGFLAHPLVVDRNTDAVRYERDVGWRQFLHFYSDNNSCLRRSVWELIPYPDVEFAEDQLWARSVIEAGYAKAYAPNAVVRHSHDYRMFEKLQRSFDESRNFNLHFGYRLSPTLLGTARSFLALSRVDIGYGRNAARGIPTAAVARRVAQNAMLVLGHFLGSHAGRIPVSLQSRLSRDQALFRNA